jgi:hypothetical protein
VANHSRAEDAGASPKRVIFALILGLLAGANLREFAFQDVG